MSVEGDLVHIAAAGVIVACGCPDELIGKVWTILRSRPIPDDAAGVIAQVRAAIETVQTRYAT